jgi:membrane fusion protein (multidrug efflux system)
MPAIDLQLNDKSAYSERGQIESISGVIDRSTGTVSLRAVFPNKEGLLHSGGGNVIVPVQKTAALTIPQAATFEIQDKRYVYKVVDGKAQSSQVQVTRVNGGREFIVDEGLAPGDVIVAEGVGLLREGTPVKAKAAQTPVAGVTNANQSSSTETTTKSPATTTEN